MITRNRAQAAPTVAGALVIAAPVAGASAASMSTTQATVGASSGFPAYGSSGHHGYGRGYGSSGNQGYGRGYGNSANQGYGQGYGHQGQFGSGYGGPDASGSLGGSVHLPGVSGGLNGGATVGPLEPIGVGAHGGLGVG